MLVVSFNEKETQLHYFYMENLLVDLLIVVKPRMPLS